MQIHLFENLDLDSKACIAWKEGVHIGCRAEGNYYMSLYRLYDFYVEVQYHTFYDGIAGIRIIICESELEPYLEQINLDNLFG